MSEDTRNDSKKKSDINGKALLATAMTDLGIGILLILIEKYIL